MRKIVVTLNCLILSLSITAQITDANANKLRAQLVLNFYLGGQIQKIL